MMAAILNSALLDSDTLFSSLRFTQKHSHSTLTLTQTNSIWLKLIHSHSTLWWQLSWILPSWFHHLGFSHLSFSSQTHSHLLRLVPTICTKRNLHSFILTQLDDGSHLEFYHCWIKKTSLIHSDSTWWWQPSWILPCWIQTPCFLLPDSLKNTLTPHWFWLKLI